MSAISVERYHPALREEWDRFVAASINGTFLHNRDYMEYHADRFEDHSLVASSGGRIVALLPANRSGDVITSHGGLTFGGLLIGESMKSSEFAELFESIAGELRTSGISVLDYRPAPYIYHRYPADYDVYALFRAGAVLTRTTLLSVVRPGAPLPLQERRRRQIRKAERAGLQVDESDDIPAYWEMLSKRLAEGHGTKPVHTLEEILRLRARFTDNIRLFACTRDSEMLGGVLVYESERVARTQYIAGSDEGRTVGAVDAVLNYLIASRYQSKEFIDLGSSEEGETMNSGLVEQKEGFGARGVAMQRMELRLNKVPA